MDHTWSISLRDPPAEVGWAKPSADRRRLPWDDRSLGPAEGRRGL